MKPIANNKRYVPFKGKTTVLLLLVVVVLALAPLVIAKNGEFAGADDKAGQAIAEIAPGYTPWFKPIWEPPSGEVASLLFAVQAAAGAGIIGYTIGFWRGRKEKADGKK